MKTICKRDLIAETASALGVEKKDVEATVNTFVAATSRAISEGNRVILPGIGVFKTIRLQPMKSFNVSTKQPVVRPERVRPKFKFAVSIKNAFKGNQKALLNRHSDDGE